MGDIRDDGRGRGGGAFPSSLVGEGKMDVRRHLFDEEMRANSRRELPDLEKTLKERGAIFSQDRRFAIFLEHGLPELRRKKKDGFPVGCVSPTGLLINGSRKTLLSLFEMLEQYPDRECPYPTREEWS